MKGRPALFAIQVQGKGRRRIDGAEWLRAPTLSASACGEMDRVRLPGKTSCTILDAVNGTLNRRARE
jgi:hypothetical protein